jgi:predicted TIM-barrel fold metal-dependent hydrolase
VGQTVSVGPANVVFASDAPFASIPKSIEMMNRITELSERERDMIMVGNAERLMRTKFR